MSIDELWALRDEIATALRAKITEETRELERRLALLKGNPSKKERRVQRRPYPKVLPSTGTLPNHPKLGQGGVSNPNGSSRNCKPVRSLTIWRYETCGLGVRIFVLLGYGPRLRTLTGALIARYEGT